MEYKELFNRAKAAYGTGAYDDATLEFLFPDLKVSEDERIRKFLIDYFTSYKIGNVATKLNGYRIDDILAYLEKQKEQEPAEWSEEDENMIRSILDNLRRYQLSMPNFQVELQMRWLKNLPGRFNLEPKQEWSEDDEKKINFLSRLIEFQVKDDEYCFGDGRLISKKEAIEMLKSFRPQPKQEWSEEDSKRYISIGTTLETSVVLSKEDYDANMAWLRKLVNAKKYSGSRPSWKPTKEQMEALESCFCEFGEGCPDEDGLRSLYNDLKKLIYENK